MGTGSALRGCRREAWERGNIDIYIIERLDAIMICVVLRRIRRLIPVTGK